MKYLKNFDAFIVMLKQMTIISTTPREIYSVFGNTLATVLLFFPFIWVALLKLEYSLSYKDFFLVFFACIACGLLFHIPSYFIYLKCMKTFLYKYILTITILGMTLSSLKAFFTASLFIIFTPFTEYRDHIAITHIVLAVGYLAMLIILFLMAQKNSRNLYYKRRYGVLFVDQVAVSMAESLPNFVGKLTCGILFPYMTIMVILTKTKSLDYGHIFLATAFTLFGITTSILLFKAVYRLLVILPEVKRTTGEDIFSDVHNFLRDNPERVQKLFGKKCSQKFEQAG